MTQSVYLFPVLELSGTVGQRLQWRQGTGVLLVAKLTMPGSINTMRERGTKKPPV